jgi:hypothetical protein
MASKNSSKISIKPMNNAAAIASTLGISAGIEPKDEQTARKTSEEVDDSQNAADKEQSAEKSETKKGESGNKIQTANDKASAAKKNREASSATTSNAVAELNQATTRSAATSQTAEMPLLIEIKRKFPGKELFILSLLYLQRNNRGLVQMTVGSMMALYSSVFQDVIKDDTARRSLKRLFDAGFIKTTSIPGNNSGYIYEIGDLLEAENLTQAEKEEFFELTEFVKSRLNGASG